MRHESVDGDKRYIEIARWANQHHIFQGMRFDEFSPRIAEEIYYSEVLKRIALA